MAKRRISDSEDGKEVGSFEFSTDVNNLGDTDGDDIRDETKENEQDSLESFEEESYAEFYNIDDFVEQPVVEQEQHSVMEGDGGMPAEYDFENILKAQSIAREFFEQDFFREKLASMFRRFFNGFRNGKYVKKIRQMCSENLESIEVSYIDIEEESTSLARILNQHAEKAVEIMNDALFDVVKIYFQNYHMIRPEVRVRIMDLPTIDDIRSLRNSHLGRFVRVPGVVTRRSGVFPLFSVMRFSCLKCKAVFGPFLASSFKPTHCFECQSRGPFEVNTSETVYKDFQKLTIQEIPGTVPAGLLPRSKDVLLFHDLIDCAKPGEEVEVIGIYKNNFSAFLNIKNGFPVFSTVIEASSVCKRVGRIEITEDDVKDIKKIARHPEIRNIIIDSIAPSVYKHRDVKRAVALTMFGGVAKESLSHRIRGDINVLILGDPGTAKSQFLRYVSGTSHRAVLATGQGASSVGLTACVRKDPVIGEWTLEGGAFVLADRGVCLIDEFDKMNEHDRTSIHEAMEQQSISISKAGIVTTLHARCSVIAAANPVRGRYNTSLTFVQNVNLSDPIISRFDILCVVRDVIDAGEDEKTAEFVVESHKGRTNEEVEGFDAEKMIIGQDLLKKYIMYARTSVTPIFSGVDIEKVSQLYSELRKESLPSGLPITARHVESIVRISEAFARMRLSFSVSAGDIDEAILVVLDSFMGAQKYSVSKSLRKKFVKYFSKNNVDILVFLLREMFNEKLKAFRSQTVSIDEFERRALSLGFSVSTHFYSSDLFRDGGFFLNKETRKILRNIH